MNKSVAAFLLILFFIYSISINVVLSFATASTVPNFKLPLPSGYNWLLSVEVGTPTTFCSGGIGGKYYGDINDPDCYHSEKLRYSLDFIDNNKEEGELTGVKDVDVLASETGRVIDSTLSASFGYTILIDHDIPYDGTGYTTRYAHLKNPLLVSIGTDVVQGDKIGVMGDTPGLPYSTGIHIHFEIRYNDNGETQSVLLKNTLVDGRKMIDYKVGTINSPKYYLSTNTPAQTMQAIYVDFAYTGTESGTQNQPFNTLTEAIGGVQVGGKIMIKGGATSETFSGINKIQKKVTIKSYSGTATIGNGSGSGITYKLPDTGQTRSYTDTFGEDSDYTINPPSYTDNGDGTITDNNTGLMWQKEDDNVLRNWDDAVSYSESLPLAGYDDWRLPEIDELGTIVNYGLYNPAINTIYFHNTNLHYWSANTSVFFSAFAWNVRFEDGLVGHPNKSSGYYVRCVRGKIKVPDFTDNGDGTVTNNNTGLMWQQEDDNRLRGWRSSLVYSESLSLGGYSDWRLPSINELKSIVDYTKGSPSIDEVYFHNTGFAKYWSSTTSVKFPNSAWYVDFGLSKYHDGGNVLAFPKSDGHNVRCVRGGMIIPSVPTGITTTADFGQIILSWDIVPGATSYNIYWNTSPGVTKETGIQISDINATSYTHTGLSFLTRYYYILIAENSSGESIESSEVSEKPKSGFGEF